MTIRRGEPWGEPVARPPDLSVVDDDAALAAAVVVDRSRPMAVRAGDLHRSLGAPGERSTVQRLPMDLLVVTLDGREVPAAAHVVARRSWWRGPIVAVMNTDHIGAWNVAPRAHPNDGRFDVVEVAPSMTVRQRIQARARLPQGTHVPHPAITVRTAREADWTFERALRVWIDGVDRGPTRALAVRIDPDAYALHV